MAAKRVSFHMIKQTISRNVNQEAKNINKSLQNIFDIRECVHLESSVHQDLNLMDHLICDESELDNGLSTGKKIM